VEIWLRQMSHHTMVASLILCGRFELWNENFGGKMQPLILWFVGMPTLFDWTSTINQTTIHDTINFFIQ
jgi:hypothetical protein